jgi:hypothetical protein
MRRWIAICLLALLPLQFGWAAVASYCADESPTAATHLGHHAHAQAADDLQADGSETTPSSEACDHCHCTCAAAVFGGSLPSCTLPSARPASGPDPSIAVAAMTRPERPQWPLLA